MTASRATAPDVRDQILDEATRCLAARGFDGATLQEIAAAVGIRKPSLLYHFESKEALRLAVLERLLAHWNEVLPRLLIAASGEERFEALLRELVGFFAADPDRARLLLREILDRPAEVRALMAHHLPRWVDVVCHHIRKGQEEKLIHAEVDPEAYVVHVLHLVVSAVATQACTGALLSVGAHGSQRRQEREQRYLGELVRLARSALFVEPTTKRSSTSARARPGRNTKPLTRSTTSSKSKPTKTTTSKPTKATKATR